MKKQKLIFLVVVLFLVGGLSSDYVSSKQVKKAFLDAVDSGDLETVQKLLTKDPNLLSIRDNRIKGADWSVLYLAIREGHSDIVELLLSKGANPNQKDAQGMGPLHWVAKAGDANLVEVLVKYGADVNGGFGEFRHPPLFFATSREVTEALIVNGADIGFLDKRRSTPLHSIADSGQTEAAEVLIAHGANINAENITGWMPLHRAARSGQKKMIELLAAKGTNINAKDKRGLTALNLAVDDDWGLKQNRTEAAKALISCGAEYTIRDVAWLGDATRVGALLEGDPALANDTSGQYRKAVLFAAVREGHSSIVELLLAHGAKLDVQDKRGTPPLHVAAHAGHIDVLEMLLEKGVDANQRGAHGELALHWAAAKGHVEVAQVLIGAGSKVNTKTDKHRVDMDEMMEEDADVVKHQLRYLELCEKQRQATLAGSSLQIEEPPRVAFAAGDTALHSAAQWDHEDIVKLLLDKGADVNATNRWDETPLHYGTIFHHKEVVKILIEAGADMNVKDKEGRTALWLARSPRGAGCTEIVELLISKDTDK